MQLEQLLAQEQAWLRSIDKTVHTQIQKFARQKVKLDIGGVKFTTTLATLRGVPSLLSVMFSGR